MAQEPEVHPHPMKMGERPVPQKAWEGGKGKVPHPMKTMEQSAKAPMGGKIPVGVHLFVHVFTNPHARTHAIAYTYICTQTLRGKKPYSYS